ncbi:MAG: enoyl-CoA hydratase/isomerase family protein [Actinobacteria bacterium]|nr:enoyl-CoA hydratase/isomerase family protein [Actinomycetota bacterium]
MSEERTLLERRGSVHVLTLNDPERRNAIGFDLAAELVDRALSLVADPEARALVVAGAGTAFCAGADLPEVFGNERPTAEMRAVLRAYYECFLSIRALPFPTFAAVHGPAVGAGLNLALACDIRIASPTARFGATFTRIGLHPGGGCSYFLVAAIGRQRALQFLLEGGTMTGSQAVEVGLAASLADDPLTAAVELAQSAAALEPALARDVVRSVEIASSTGFEATLDFESWAQAESTHNARFREFVSTFD